MCTFRRTLFRSRETNMSPRYHANRAYRSLTSGDNTVMNVRNTTMVAMLCATMRFSKICKAAFLIHCGTLCKTHAREITPHRNPLSSLLRSVQLHRQLIKSEVKTQVTRGSQGEDHRESSMRAGGYRYAISLPLSPSSSSCDLEAAA